MAVINQANMSRAYAFWIVSLIFGLPLLTSYYAISFLPNYTTDFLLPYLLICILVGVLILRFGSKSAELPSMKDYDETHAPTPRVKQSNDRCLYAALSFGTIAVVSYGAMKYYLAAVYPGVSSEANVAGAIYLAAVSLAVLLGFPTLVYRVFPSMRSALGMKARGIGYAEIAKLVGALYFATYMLLVNQILITGFNTQPGNVVSSPNGIYPYAYVFTAGPPPSAWLEALLYDPYVLIQINPTLNFIFQPFEMLFAIVLSTLVAATFVLTIYFIKRTVWHSCATGAAVSGMGSFLGLTATCPSCLAPTLISAFFGGLSATVQTSYSNLSGVILPPIVSIVALVLALLYLDRQTRKLQLNTELVLRG